MKRAPPRLHLQLRASRLAPRQTFSALESSTVYAAIFRRRRTAPTVARLEVVRLHEPEASENPAAGVTKLAASVTHARRAA